MKNAANDSIISHLASLVSEDKHLLEEMARVGYIDGTRLEIVVFTDDSGYKPHFHVRDAATKGAEFHSCIEILRPFYFKHFGKEDILNTKTKRELMKFFESPSDSFEEMNNWNVLLRLWNQNNSKMKVQKDLEMPDYRKLT